MGGTRLSVYMRIKRQVNRCLDEFARGELTADGLHAILDAVEDVSARQDLLFLRTSAGTVNSEVVGMLLLQDGEIEEGPPDPRDWPYQTVIDAIRDGWRVIKFPELALWVDETRTYEVGGEFVLERWNLK